MKKKLIDHISIIASKSKGAGFKKSSGIKELKALEEYLGCNSEEALLFSLVIYLSVSDDKPRINALSSHLGEDAVEFLSCVCHLQNLQRKSLIRRSHSYKDKGLTDSEFHVPSEIIEALSSEERLPLPGENIASSANLFSHIGGLARKVDKDMISPADYEQELLDLMANHPDHYTIKNLVDQGFRQLESVFLLTLCAEFIKSDSDIYLHDLLSVFIEDDGAKFTFKSNLVRGNSDVVKRGFIRLEEGYFRTDRNLTLTDKGLKLLFDQRTGFESDKHITDRDVILPGSIGSKKLYYNEKEAEQLGRIRQMLTRSSYTKIIRELKKHHMARGIAILFYGTPGTGKTESVYQLARTLRKPVFNVDISKTKDMYFGESEKEVKRLFAKYRRMVESTPNCPIMLFNEADGVLGKRRPVSSSAVSQTENAIQNIILQEMEQLRGIMIATTNLTINLDSAFERRFLYKVKFEAPGKEVRTRIWRSHIPSLKPTQAHSLASTYAFSGGQIANIARKVISGQIIGGATLGQNEIERFCREERIEGEVRRVGF